MEQINSWTQVALKSLTALGESLMTTIPSIIGALLLLLVGWILAKAFSYTIGKSLKLVGTDKLMEKANFEKFLNKAKIEMPLSKFIGKVVYWVIMLLFFVVAADSLGWAVVSQSLSDLIAYLPKLFSGIAIFVIGLYIANFVKVSLRGIFDSMNVASGNIVSSFAFYIIVVILTLTALNQAGVDTHVITSNVSILLAGIVLAFAVSFGLGSRDVLKNILSSFYSKSIFEVGQTIEINGVSGTIEQIDTTSCVIKTKTGKVVFPVSSLLSEQVKISE
jgi:small-conductance mechanosensitive channel